MRAQFLKYWERVRSSFWFVPSLMAAGAAVLAFSTVGLDRSVTDKWLTEQSWAYAGGAEGASAVLAAIAGSMITIAGVVFSLTLVALSLASSQFGPRLLRNFMRDTANQVVLGVFVSTFLYCLLVLRTIRRAEESLFVPHLSVTLGVLFALCSIGFLIYFIHHVSVSIQADEIIAHVGDELSHGIERLFPQEIGQPASKSTAAASESTMPEAFDREARPVTANEDGYLQIIDSEALLSLAKKEDAIFRLSRRPGHYVVRGASLLMVWPGERVTDELISRIRSTFVLGNQRTPEQDVEFPVHQLVEIAVRALSPGINDPFTAMTCIDRLSSALSQLAKRKMPEASRTDEEGRLRVVAPAISFAGVTDAAFNQIRQYSRSSAAVTIRLLEAIETIAGATTRSADRATLHRHAEMIERGAREGLSESEDVTAVQERFQSVLRALSEA
ncbi:DUF2254 domain-containing protein [soil metagenome]